MPIQSLTIVDLTIALGMVMAAIALSLWQQVGLEWNLITASGRSIAQLLVVGFFLTAVFQISNPWLVVGILLVMVSISAITVRNRIHQPIPRLLLIVIGSILSYRLNSYQCNHHPAVYQSVGYSSPALV